MSEKQPLRARIARDEIATEHNYLADTICDKCCRYLKYAMCIGAALLIVYLIFSFIGGINGADYLPKSSNNIVTTLVGSSHATGSDPFTDWQECDSINSNEPEIFAYHIHAIFDGNDQDSCNVAMSGYHSFINQFNENMEECTFSHSNSGQFQTEICYFPRNFQDDDFPMSSNAIFQSTNYAFFIPKSEFQESMVWWMQHHYNSDNAFDYVFHSVSGCQINDHTKWLVNSKGYNDQVITDNLLCCHNGPSACSCDIVTYNQQQDDNDECLTIVFDENDSSAQFTMDTCEEWTSRGLGSWREVSYSSDNNLNWFQIENFGDATQPMYMCLTVDNNYNKNVGIGSKIGLKDCSLNQNINENEWVSELSKFKWNENRNQIIFVGNNMEKEETGQLCLNVKNMEMMVTLTLQDCNDASVFGRSFTP